ncbi:hypothetical protein Tco_1424875 [Tanacetum coccineum]
MMRGNDVKKTPGRSSIELEGEFHEFLAADKSHSLSERIYKVLGEIISLSRLEDASDANCLGPYWTTLVWIFTAHVVKRLSKLVIVSWFIEEWLRQFGLISFLGGIWEALMGLLQVLFVGFIHATVNSGFYLLSYDVRNGVVLDFFSTYVKYQMSLAGSLGLRVSCFHGGIALVLFFARASRVPSSVFQTGAVL